MIQGKLLSYGDDLSEAYLIRRKVFLEEHGIPEGLEFDGRDDMAIHVTVYEGANNKIPVATGRICFDGSSCEIGHIAVLKEYRRKKYGDFTVRMLMNKAFTAGLHKVECIVPAGIIEFFKTIGFTIVGDEFTLNERTCYRMQISDRGVIKACKGNLNH